jgi:hypothetical protein
MQEAGEYSTLIQQQVHLPLRKIKCARFVSAKLKQKEYEKRKWNN